MTKGERPVPTPFPQPTFQDKELEEKLQEAAKAGRYLVGIAIAQPDGELGIFAKTFQFPIDVIEQAKAGIAYHIEVLKRKSGVPQQQPTTGIPPHMMPPGMPPTQPAPRTIPGPEKAERKGLTEEQVEEIIAQARGPVEEVKPAGPLDTLMEQAVASAIEDGCNEDDEE